MHQLACDTVSEISHSYNVLNTEVDTTGCKPVQRFLDIDNKDKDFQPLPHAACRRLFEGIAVDGRNNAILEKIYLSLPFKGTTMEEQEIIDSAIISFDIDSFLAVPKSLGVAKKGLKVRNSYSS